ncbi:MAG: cell division protein FtsQ/DivIB [Alphaproteobacteria bacterium]|nr:cell division protein FtsQ/DivIB [Alphaproteobacteria bacterium]
MDGRGRIAEPVTGAEPRAWAGAAPASRRARTRWNLARTRVERTVRRYLLPLRNVQVPRGSGMMAVMAFVLASAAFGAVRGGHLPAVADELRDWRDAAANLAGFRISTIALAGNRQMTREEILTTAGVTGRTSLLFLNVADARARLLDNPWISAATVLKLYPGRLHVAVTEREAFALWQRDGKLTVISGDGTVLEPHFSRRFAQLPLVVGAGAEVKAKAFLAVLDAYPQVRGQMRAAILVAERRWNLKLESGIDIRLPETGVAQALDTLVKLDRDKKLLSRDVSVIDLRLPDRVTVRLSDEAWAARDETIKDLKPKKKGGSA